MTNALPAAEISKVGADYALAEEQLRQALEASSVARDAQEAVERYSEKLQQYPSFRAVRVLDGVTYYSEQIDAQQALVLLVNRPVGFERIEGLESFEVADTGRTSQMWWAL